MKATIKRLEREAARVPACRRQAKNFDIIQD
jgi:hypothetical protein